MKSRDGKSQREENSRREKSITLHHAPPHYTQLHYTTLPYPTLHYIALHYITLHSLLITPPQSNYNHTTLITLRHNYNSTTLQLQLHYTALHPAVVGEVTDQVTTATIALQPLQKTQLQPPFGPSVDSLCHPWFTTTNLSYRFPIFEAFASALCGTTGMW